ncbi:MAG TPA: hypothetical protein VK171_01545 [Fimbriimonas sp.]|nr:hypothetical protein [Fimbriimonas sp.]
MPHHTGDISLFDVDSASVLSYFDDVTLTLTNMTANTASVKAKGQRSSIMKSSGTVSVPLRSISTTTTDGATHLDLVSLALGALTFDCFTSTTVDISYAKAVVPCVGSRYKMEDNTKLILAAALKVQCVNGTGEALLTPFDDAAALSASNANYSLAFNGVTYTIPSLIQEGVLVAERDGIQDISLKLEGRSPDSGNYPASPTGTTGLLQKAMNAYNTAIPFAFQSITGTVGVAVSGNLKFDSVSFSIEDEQIVPTSYTFRNYGAWTVEQGS